MTPSDNWLDDLKRSAAAVVILGPDYYATNGPDIMAEAMRQGKPIMLLIPADRSLSIPPLFTAYKGRKALIDIPTYDPAVIVAKSMEQARSWGLNISGGYEHTWEDLPSSG